MEVDNYYQVLLFSYRLCQVVLNSYFCTSLLVFTLMRSAFRIPIIVPKLARRQLPWHPYGDNCSSLFTTWMLGDFILSYDGMIVGKPSRDTDLDVNPVRNKELSNMRSTNKDETVRLSPPRLLWCCTFRAFDWYASNLAWEKYCSRGQ
ncbi:uncharacterized protein LOC141707895 isoform X2 [Apium graveolens]